MVLKPVTTIRNREALIVIIRNETLALTKIVSGNHDTVIVLPIISNNLRISYASMTFDIFISFSRIVPFLVQKNLVGKLVFLYYRNHVSGSYFSITNLSG